jgi:PST family polysaccharide transporter
VRRTGDLARINIWGGLAATALSVLVVIVSRENTVVATMLIVSISTMVVSWYYARKISVPITQFNGSGLTREVQKLLRLGIASLSANIFAGLVTYLIRIWIIADSGVEAAGHYQAAWALGGVYVGFILSAMGADYLPRITAVVNSNEKVNQLANEQTEIALLMAIPGILGTLACAPWAIHIFYSKGFEPAGEILRWHILGILGRVMSWPLAYILLAKGKSGIYIGVEFLANGSYALFVWLGLKYLGVKGVGIAFCGSYLVHLVSVWIAARELSGFSWNRATLQLICGSLIISAAAFVGTVNESVTGCLVVGIAAAGAAVYGFVAVRKLLAYESSRS